MHREWIIAGKTSGLVYICGNEEGRRRIQRANERVNVMPCGSSCWTGSRSRRARSSSALVAATRRRLRNRTVPRRHLRAASLRGRDGQRDRSIPRALRAARGGGAWRGCAETCSPMARTSGWVRAAGSRVAVHSRKRHGLSSVLQIVESASCETGRRSPESNHGNAARDRGRSRPFALGLKWSPERHISAGSATYLIACGSRLARIRAHARGSEGNGDE